ncbi:MAG: hypothetical protein AAB512_01495 [Patescibacteria group bacterium]
MAVEVKHICTISKHEFRPKIVPPGHLSIKTYEDEHGNDLAALHIRCKPSGVGVVTPFEKFGESNVSVHIKDWTKPDERPLIQITREPVLISGTQYVELVSRRTTRRLRAMHVAEKETPDKTKEASAEEKVAEFVTTPRDRKIASATSSLRASSH